MPASCRDLTLLAGDNYALAARLWQPGQMPITASAIVNAGGGIAFRFYDKFAQYLARHGVATLLYDYRGIGGSRPAELKGFVVSVEDWGCKDFGAAVRWMKDQYPSVPLRIVAHSIGTLVAGFSHEGQSIDRMLFIGGHTGFHGDYAWWSRPWLSLLTHRVVPMIARFHGYFPGKRLHLGEDVPQGIALEWAQRTHADIGANVRNESGAPDFARIEDVRARFALITAPTLVIRITDDPFATITATQRILAMFPNAPAQIDEIKRRDVGGRAIGHFGFFRSRFADTLWPRALRWISASRKPESLP